MRYTLITGASSGIGEEFARQLAEKKIALILVSRSEEKLNALANELKGKYQIDVHVIRQDLAEVDAAEKVFDACRQRNIEIDFLINNAGIGLIGPFHEHESKKINEMLILNTLTPTKLTYLFLPQLKANRGTLLNVASQAAFQPLPYMASYGATKAYMLNFSEGLRVELEQSGVHVTTLCPGPTYTRFFERAGTTPDVIRFKFNYPQLVVKQALDGVEKGKTLVIPGTENKMMTFMNRFYPRSVLAKMSQFLVKKRG